MKFARRPAARDDASGHPWPKPRILAFQRTRKRRRQAQASTAPPSVLQVLRVIARQRAEIRRHAAAAAIGGAPPDAPALCQLYAHARATFSVRETISRRLTRRSSRPARGTRSFGCAAERAARRAASDREALSSRLFADGTRTTRSAQTFGRPARSSHDVSDLAEASSVHTDLYDRQD